MGMSCSTHGGEERNAYKILAETLEGTRPLGTPRCRWEDNNNMDLRGIRWDVMDWINLSHDRDQWRALVNIAMDLRIP
jgi:hypothetical protein